jgi:3-oxoadipate enol-lactonase/4-carboxymuconolactone decarboxylase
MWTPCLAPLLEQFRVIRIDTRGHGRSPAAGDTATAGCTADASCTIGELGRDALGVLDELGIRRAHVAGLSLGGMVAMWLASHHPDRVARLVLICTSAYLPPAAGWLDRATTVRAQGPGAITAPVVARWLTPELAARDPELVASLHSMIAGTDAQSYAQCCDAIAAMDLRPDLPRIAAPTLVLAGSRDPATPPEHAQAIALGIPGARVGVLDPAAHLATAEQPATIARAMLDHLGGANTRSAGFRTRREVLGDAHVDGAVAATTPFTAAFQDFITRYAWGEVWTRPGLSRRDRSIATLAALVALGAEQEIAMHVRAAVRNGVTEAEIAEVLLHTALYAGLPRANRAYAIARDVLSEPPA